MTFFKLRGRMDADKEVTFLFQFGMVRDTATVNVNKLNLKTLKDLACDFINLKVSGYFSYIIDFFMFFYGAQMF